MSVENSDEITCLPVGTVCAKSFATGIIMNSKMASPKKQKILLVCHDQVVGKVLRNVLADEDYMVFPAASSDETLKLATAGGVDLALLDLQMPNEDGWRVFEQLSVKHPRVPIVLITTGPVQIFSALASCVSALLAKPLNLVEVLATVQRLLGNHAEVRAPVS